MKSEKNLLCTVILEDWAMLGRLRSTYDCIVKFNSFGKTNKSIMIINDNLLKFNTDNNTDQLNYQKREFM